MANNNFASRAIRTRDTAAERERERWARVQQFADKGDVAGFMGAYAKYLETNGCYSPSRRAIRDMAREAWRMLKEQDIPQ